MSSSDSEAGCKEIDRSADLFATPVTKTSPKISRDAGSGGCGCSPGNSPWTNHMVKLKTYKTYGKDKWRRQRKSSAEWETVKNIEPGNCYRQETICCDEKPSKNEKKPSQTTSRFLFGDSDELTPCRPCVDERGAVPSVFVTSTPTANVSIDLSPLNIHDLSADIRENVDSKWTFHRSVSFNTSLPSFNDSKTSLRSVKALVLSQQHGHTSPYSSTHSCKDLHISHLSLKKQILDLCEQDRVLSLQEYADESTFKQKVGEGSYGEVYERTCDNSSMIVKIVPVGSEDVLIHGIQQMSYEEIITEMSISKTLSEMKETHASGFIHLHKLLYCQGSYPEELVGLWERWDGENKSENDNPQLLPQDQKYILFETDNCGTDLEKFTLKDEAAAWSVLKQVIVTLATAECRYQFEHRDLHWGNVLISETQEESFVYNITEDNVYELDPRGLCVTIIDFTLSRIESEGCVVFTNLSQENDLFTGKGDIQFDVYRKMKAHNGNNWEVFSPYTNVLWIHYLTQKLVEKISCKRSSLNVFMRQVRSYCSAYEILMSGDLD